MSMHGRYLQLSSGQTYVVEDGDGEGPTMLLIHGATVPHWQFDWLVPRLRATAARVVRFDLFGHGLSDRPAVRYDFGLFLGQALEVLDALGASRPLTVLGHSFGAAVAAAVCYERAALVDRLILVAPLRDFMARSRWSRLFGLPFVGQQLMRSVGIRALERRRRRRYAAIGAEHLTTRFIEQVRTPGFAEALASMFSNGTLGDQCAHYKRLHAFAREIVVVAGGADHVIPLSDVAHIRGLLPNHRYVEIADAQHNLLLTHSEAVASVITRDRGAPHAGDGLVPEAPTSGATRA